MIEQHGILLSWIFKMTQKNQRTSLGRRVFLNFHLTTLTLIFLSDLIFSDLFLHPFYAH